MVMIRGLFTLLLWFLISYTTTAQAPEEGTSPFTPFEGSDISSISPAVSLENIDFVIQPDFCLQQNGMLQVTGPVNRKDWNYSLDGRSFQSSDRFQNLSSGMYQLYILDVYGNMQVQDFEIPAKSNINLETISISPSECMHPTGIIQLTPIGGEEPYTLSLGSRLPQRDLNFQDVASGSYNLHITDARGCAFDTTLTIPRNSCPVYIPNVFSPNGDGVNDLFQIKIAGDENIVITRFFIFDRWGNNVYKKYNLRLQSDAEWWDGTYKHFTSSAGIFNYYLEIEFENGDRETYKGDLTLIR